MKQKVTNVTYRKDSETFPKWMKYEIEILNEDGTTEKIPAYGKDLQDALSRVVHDKTIEMVTSKVSRIPIFVWPILWFTYVGLLVIAATQSNNPWILVIGLIGIVFVMLNLNWWTKEKNVKK